LLIPFTAKLYHYCTPSGIPRHKIVKAVSFHTTLPSTNDEQDEQTSMMKDQHTNSVMISYATYEQKEYTKMLKQQRNTVSFSDDVTTHVIPKLNACETFEVYYSRADYKKFHMAQRMREDRQEAKQMRRMIEDASATREARAQELAAMQPPVDDLLLIQPPSMPVRQVSGSIVLTPVTLSGRPGLPARQATTIVTDIWTATVKVSEPRKGPPTRPVRQASKMNVNEMGIEQNAFPESLGSLLDRALAA
jgi:hypothetical protein